MLYGAAFAASVAFIGAGLRDFPSPLIGSFLVVLGLVIIVLTGTRLLLERDDRRHGFHSTLPSGNRLSFTLPEFQQKSEYERHQLLDNDDIEVWWREELNRSARAEILRPWLYGIRRALERFLLLR